MFNPEQQKKFHIEYQLGSIEDLENDIINAKSFDELKEILDALGESIIGSNMQTSNEIWKRIEQVRNGHRTIDFITREFGIRDAVEKLLQDDLKYKKRVLNKNK